MLLVGAAAQANPSQEVAKARAVYDQGEFEEAIRILEPLLYPKPLINDDPELVEAHRLLGGSYVLTQKPDKAKDEFESLLYIDPNFDLDPAVEDANVFAVFTETKRTIEKKLEIIRKQRERDAAKANKPSREITITNTVTVDSPWVNFIPFGVGQFKNGQRGKGAFFFTSEILLGGTSVILFTAQALEYGIPSRPIPPRDSEFLRTRQIIQVTSGALFLAIYGWGVIDAFANSKPKVVNTKKTERDLVVVPYVSPDGLGVSASWEF